MAIEDHKKCPKCGGDSGWLQKIPLNGFKTEFGDWGDKETDAEADGFDGVESDYPKTVICTDCSAQISKRFSVAVGDNPHYKSR